MFVITVTVKVSQAKGWARTTTSKATITICSIASSSLLHRCRRFSSAQVMSDHLSMPSLRRGKESMGAA